MQKVSNDSRHGHGNNIAKYVPVILKMKHENETCHQKLNCNGNF